MRIFITLLFAFLSNLILEAKPGDVPKAKLAAFRTWVEPVLKRVCVGCLCVFAIATGKCVGE